MLRCGVRIQYFVNISFSLQWKHVEKWFSHTWVLFILEFYYLAMQSINDFTCSVYYANAKMQINLIQTHLKMGWKRHRCSRARLAIDRCVYSATPEFHVNNGLRQKRNSANLNFLKNEKKWKIVVIEQCLHCSMHVRWFDLICFISTWSVTFIYECNSETWQTIVR